MEGDTSLFIFCEFQESVMLAVWAEPVISFSPQLSFTPIDESEGDSQKKKFKKWQPRSFYFMLHVFVQLLSHVQLFATHGLQQARLPCPSPSPRACSNSRPLSRWCCPTISSSLTLFSSYSQSFLTSGSFPMSWFFTLGGQSIGAAASVSLFWFLIFLWVFSYVW